MSKPRKDGDIIEGLISDLHIDITHAQADDGTIAVVLHINDHEYLLLYDNAEKLGAALIEHAACAKASEIEETLKTAIPPGAVAEAAIMVGPKTSETPPHIIAAGSRLGVKLMECEGCHEKLLFTPDMVKSVETSTMPVKTMCMDCAAFLMAERKREGRDFFSLGSQEALDRVNMKIAGQLRRN